MTMRRSLVTFLKKGKKNQNTELQVDFKKIKPPTFDEKVEEYLEVWIINMNKYFQIYEYDNNLKTMLDIEQIQGKITLWLEEVKSMQGIKE